MFQRKATVRMHLHIRTLPYAQTRHEVSPLLGLPFPEQQPIPRRTQLLEVEGSKGLILQPHLEIFLHTPLACLSITKNPLHPILHNQMQKLAMLTTELVEPCEQFIVLRDLTPLCFKDVVLVEDVCSLVAEEARHSRESTRWAQPSLVGFFPSAPSLYVSISTEHTGYTDGSVVCSSCELDDA